MLNILVWLMVQLSLLFHFILFHFYFLFFMFDFYFLFVFFHFCFFFLYINLFLVINCCVKIVFSLKDLILRHLACNKFFKTWDSIIQLIKFILGKSWHFSPDNFVFTTCSLNRNLGGFILFWFLI